MRIGNKGNKNMKSGNYWGGDAAAPVDVRPERPSFYADLTPRGPLQVTNQVVGVLRQQGDGGLVVPSKVFKNSDLGSVVVDKRNLNGAPFDMTVVCEVLNPDSSNKKYLGKIIEVLGDFTNNDAKTLAVLRQFGLSETFPDAVLNEVKDLPNNPTPEMVDEEIGKGRTDCRDLLTITIDGEEAKDLDDAISIKKLDNGDFKLYVHIADVSNYVRENTVLDGEAFVRGTSNYLVDKVIPMLPPKLSNGLCSLNPEVDRLAMTAEMDVDSNGHVYKGYIYESVIRSNARMSYNECYRILFEPKNTDEKDYGPIVPMLQDMKKLTDILKTMRVNRGALSFVLPETKVIMNEDGTVKDVMPYPTNYCHGMIEEFMICANEFVAERFASMNYPFVYRVHDEPDRIKIARFCAVARTFGASGVIRGKITPSAISEYIKSVREDDSLPMLNMLLLRALAKAVYSSENCGHFGLASEFYCHFTSPIRRYPDLYIHRIIKSYLHNEDKRRHFGPMVEKVALHSSEMERNSVDAERASVDIKCCEFMADKVGEHFDGMISSIIPAGCFIELASSIEGFIPFRLMKDHYVFDERTVRAVGVRSGMKLSIGMKVRVVVAAVDTDTNHIDFVFEEGFEQRSERNGRGDRDTRGDRGNRNFNKEIANDNSYNPKSSSSGSSSGRGKGKGKGDRKFKNSFGKSRGFGQVGRGGK